MNRVRNTLRRIRRRAFEVAGSARFSRPALFDLDRKLEHFLDIDHGVFIEAGANDGYTQSNTYYLEAMRGWRGLLVEPIPELAAESRRNRRSIVVEAALVAPTFSERQVTIDVGGLTSSIVGAFGDEDVRQEHHRRGLAVQGLSPGGSIAVPARLLSELIDEHLTGCDIDLLVLDVEGHELDALRGLELPRQAPRYACIECRHRAAVEALLAPVMRPVATLHQGEHYSDVLFVRNESAR